MRRKKSNPKLPPKYHWEFASCALQGRRSTMEDSMCIVKNLGAIENEFFVGVFDGHSGDRCSKYVSEHLPVQLVENASFNKNIEQAFQETFQKVDNDWLEICESKESDKPKEKTDIWDDGSTAVCLVYKNGVLSVANCGDSRLIVSRKFKAEQITIDHNPDCKTEKERLEAKQFKVQNNKLDGSLGVSRAFGDYSFKRPVSRGLIVNPDYFEIKGIEEIDFVILACDGLFEGESLTCQDVVDSIKEQLADNVALDKIAQNICSETIELGSNDNVSIVILKRGAKIVNISIKTSIKDEKKSEKLEREKKEKAENEERKRAKLMDEIRTQEQKADDKRRAKADKDREKERKEQKKELDVDKKSSQSKSPEKRGVLTTSSNRVPDTS